MRATGIVRRVDDLGRVVIPKEIRRTMRIREGDPLEIYTEKDGSVTFKKYSPLGVFSSELAAPITQSLYAQFNIPCSICDRDTVIQVSGIPGRDILTQALSPDMLEIMESRHRFDSPAGVQVTEKGPHRARAVFPIIVNGDVMGAIILHEVGAVMTDSYFDSYGAMTRLIVKQMAL